MKLAFVDLDETVLVNPMWPAVFPHFARCVASGSARRPSERDVIRELMARSGALRLHHDVAANDWDRLTRETAAAFGVEWSEPVAGLVERYRDFASAVAGSHQMLATLRASGWTCVAASAGFRRFQLPSLRHLGLLECFDRLLFADDVGVLKRRRAFYGAIPADATRVACIGDSYVDDCLYPASFGFACVWFTGVRRSRAIACGRPPDVEVSRLDMVADALEEVTASRRHREPDGADCPACGGPGEEARPCRLCRCLARLCDPWDGDGPPDLRGL